MANYLAVDIGSSGGKLVLTELTTDKKINTRVVHRFDTTTFTAFMMKSARRWPVWARRA